MRCVLSDFHEHTRSLAIQRAVPEPHAHEVLVRVKRTGICGSDVHYLTHGKIGKYTLAEPMCLGHESSGVVVKTGAMVPAQVLGLRVAIEPYSPCRMCDYCKGGYYHVGVFCYT